MTEKEFDLEKLKSDLEVITEAATMYIQKHNPNRNMLNEPYPKLIRGAVNDFLYLESHGFKIVRKEENSRLLEEKAKLIEEIEKQIGTHDYTVDGDYNVIRVQTLREYLKELKNIQSSQVK